MALQHAWLAQEAFAIADFVRYEGPNNVAVCWGPVLGAKVIKYQTAVVLGLTSQAVGVLAFGPRTSTVYGGFLKSAAKLDANPELTLYVIMWTLITPVIWQLLAIRGRILMPAYLGTGDTCCVDLCPLACSSQRNTHKQKQHQPC